MSVRSHVNMTFDVGAAVNRRASKIKSLIKRSWVIVTCKTNSNRRNQSSSPGITELELPGEKDRHTSLVERVNDVRTSVTIHRKSISSVFHKRTSASLDLPRGDPSLPPELIEKIASYLPQHDLVKFSRVSRDAYTAAERHLYRRPLTRRFDRLLRTVEKSPYKGDLILELALGFETDFYSVKYLLPSTVLILCRGPNYDREKVYKALLSHTPNLQQLIYQGWLQWTVSVTQPFAARHAYVMTIPTRVQTGAVPLDLLEQIPSSLKHLQFRRIYGRYHNLFQVISRNDHLESLNLYEIGDLDSLHLEQLVDLPIAQNLKYLRIRHLPFHAEANHGGVLSKILPHMPSLENFVLEITAMENEPFFSTFATCKQIKNFKFGYCERVTEEGLMKLGRHGELRNVEFMPGLHLNIEILRAIVNGNEKLKVLLLPRESISGEFQKELS